MKYIYLFMLTCLSVWSSAQNITDAQKQEALSAATNFCSLFSRFCNGERTISPLIFNLCSGADCSAFDNVRTNKETTLRNYIMAIQKEYPLTLKMELSTPSLSNCEIFYRYDYTKSIILGDLYGSHYSNTGLISIKKGNLLNVIIVFNVKQTIPLKNETTNRKLIYSIKSGKITAFDCDNSPTILYSKALKAMSDSQYSDAIKLCDQAINNGGVLYDGKKSCYFIQYMSSSMLQDYDSTLKYASLFGDIGYILYCKALIAFLHQNYIESFNYCEQLEQKLNNGEKSNQPISTVYYLLGCLYALPKSVCPLYNSSKAAYYLRRCVSFNDESYQAENYIYFLWTSNQLLQNENDSDQMGISIQDMKYSEALSYLRNAAENGYPPSYLPMGIAAHFDLKDVHEAVKWYQKSAEQGNAKAMAFLGKVLVTEPEFASRRQEAVYWLKKALQSNSLDKDIDDCEKFISREFWPGSRKDVEELLKQLTGKNY